MGRTAVRCLTCYPKWTFPPRSVGALFRCCNSGLADISQAVILDCPRTAAARHVLSRPRLRKFADGVGTNEKEYGDALDLDIHDCCCCSCRLRPCDKRAG